MKRVKIRKIIAALSLIAILVVPLTTKAVHVCEISADCSTRKHSGHEKSEKHPEHDGSACSICQFVLFPFTEAGPIASETIASVFCLSL